MKMHKQYFGKTDTASPKLSTSTTSLSKASAPKPSPMKSSTVSTNAVKPTMAPSNPAKQTPMRKFSEDAVLGRWEDNFHTLVNDFSIEECVSMFFNYLESHDLEMHEETAIAYVLTLAEGLQ